MSIENMAARFMAGAHALIDLDAYEHNLRLLSDLSPQETGLMAVVKADAYGHGAVQCARVAEHVADWLGVARIQEALVLRRRGIQAPILVLGPPNVCEISDAIRHNITLTVGTLDHLQQLTRDASSSQVRVPVHLKIDTGMRRYGFMPSESIDAAVLIANSKCLTLDGVYTHFSSSDETDPAPTNKQIAAFESVLDQMRERGIMPRYVHSANSAAILARRTGSTNMVRSGIATYGISPSDEVQVPSGFKQILSLRTVLTRRFALEAGDGVSYGLTYRAHQSEQVAATAAGYADGLPRQLSNTGWFALNGNRFPIRGRVCMDQTVIAADDSLAVGDVIEVVGPGDNAEMTLEDVARIAGTNSYEIATRVTARVPRLYRRGDRIVACEHLLLGESAYEQT